MQRTRYRVQMYLQESKVFERNEYAIQDQHEDRTVLV